MNDLLIVHYLQLGISLIGGFLVVYLAIPVLIKIAYLKDLYDKPDNNRKLHRNYIPNLGGVGIFIAFVLSYSFSGFAEQFNGYPYFFGGLVALFFCGLKDDLVGLSPLKKLGVEITVSLLLMFGSGIMIDNMFGVFGLYEIPDLAAVLLTLFTMVVVINAYNLIDGIDGLAGGIGGIASLFFAVGFWMAGEYHMFAMSLTLSAVITGYLIFNFHPASIFMGDAGSLITGFLLSVMVVKFVALNDIPGFNEYFGYSSPVLPVAFLALPLYDTIRVFTRRILRGSSPFSPDSDHIHHVLLKLGWGQRKTVVYLYSASIMIVAIALSTVTYNVNISLAIILGSTFLFFPTNGIKRNLLIKAGIDVETLFSSQQEKDLYSHLENIEVRFSKRSSENKEKTEL